jgi:cobalt-zinc-cadmium efflux system outer membrane protein
MANLARLVGHLLVVATIAASTSAMSRAAETFDESRYVQAVLRSGLEGRVAEAEAALGAAEAVGVGTWANPALGWEREALGRPGSAPGAGQVSQDIFYLTLPLVLSGRLGLEREAASKQAEAARARRERARAHLRREASLRFHAVLAVGERRAVIAASLSGLETVAQMISARQRAGDASGYDRHRIELEVAAVRDLARAAAVEENERRAAALALLGPEHRSLPRCSGTVGDMHRESEHEGLLEQLGQRRGDLRADRLESEAAALQRRAAGRRWLPEPTVAGGVQLLDAGRPGSRNGYVARVELPLPLFQRGQGERARSEALKALTDARRAAAEREAHSRLDALEVAATERRERLAVFRKEVVGRAEALQQMAKAAYHGGAADLLVLVDAERAARDARLAAIDLALEVVQAESGLRLLAGIYEADEARDKR